MQETCACRLCDTREAREIPLHVLSQPSLNAGWALRSAGWLCFVAQAHPQVFDTPCHPDRYRERRIRLPVLPGEPKNQGAGTQRSVHRQAQESDRAQQPGGPEKF